MHGTEVRVFPHPGSMINLIQWTEDPLGVSEWHSRNKKHDSEPDFLSNFHKILAARGWLF